MLFCGASKSRWGSEHVCVLCWSKKLLDTSNWFLEGCAVMMMTVVLVVIITLCSPCYCLQLIAWCIHISQQQYLNHLRMRNQFSFLVVQCSYIIASSFFWEWGAAVRMSKVVRVAFRYFSFGSSTTLGVPVRESTKKAAYNYCRYPNSSFSFHSHCDCFFKIETKMNKYLLMWASSLRCVHMHSTVFKFWVRGRWWWWWNLVSLSSPKTTFC